jgi:hypothetical protein
MHALLVRYEQEARATMSADDRAIVENVLEAIKSLVVALSVTSNETAAQVLVDGKAVGPLLVQAGRRDGGAVGGQARQVYTSGWSR